MSRSENHKVLLSYGETVELAREFKLNVLPARYLNDDNLKQVIKELKLPMVMKVDSPNIVHKNVKNGVAVGLNTVRKVEKEFKRFKKDFPGEKIIVQHQVESGLEVILGLRRDASFGLVLMIGLGGIVTEILDEKILLVGGVTGAKIRNKLEGSKLDKILKKEKVNVDELIVQASRLFELGMMDKKIVEVDVNPIFLYGSREPVIVDFKIMKKE